MKLGDLKDKERLISVVLLAAAVVLSGLAMNKVWSFFDASARAQSIVKKAAEQDKPDEKVLKEKLDAFRKIADGLKRKNLFVPIAPKRNPVTAVQGIFGSEALINGKWYKAGSSIGDAKIVAVEPTQVKISWNGQEKYFAPIASASSGSASRSRRGGGRGGDEERREGPPMMGPDGHGGRGGNMSEGDWAGMRGRMEDMRARFENMSSEEREAFRDRMRERFGGRGPGDGRGRGPGGGRGGFGGGYR